MPCELTVTMHVCLCGSVGEMVEGKLLPQPELAILSASGLGRCLREDHSVGRGEWHSPLWNPRALQTYPGYEIPPFDELFPHSGLTRSFYSMFSSVFPCQTWSGCGIRMHPVICCWPFTLPTILFCGMETQAPSCGKRAMLRTFCHFLLTPLTPPTWRVSSWTPHFKYFTEFLKHTKTLSFFCRFRLFVRLYPHSSIYL